MAEIEEKITKESEYKQYLQWRYIDNTFFLWEHGENKLKSFIDKINKVHPNIKFTAEKSKTSINFLDVNVSLIEGVIATDLYVKLTDSLQYLQSSSCQPFHCKKGIPYKQVLRLRQLVGFRYGKKHVVKILKSLVTVSFKMTLHLCIYFPFTNWYRLYPLNIGLLRFLP